MIKTYLALVNLVPAVGRFFVNFLTGRKGKGSTQKYSLLAGDINQASDFFLLQLPKIEMRNECKQHR